MTLFNRTIKLHTDVGVIAGRKLQLMFGTGRWIGAGYIGGFTAFLALDCLERGLPQTYKRRRIQFGVTTNANRVPFTTN